MTTKKQFLNEKDKTKLKKVIITYKNEKVSVYDLLMVMTKEIAILKRHQCKPKADCLFKGQEYLDKKYTKDLPNEPYKDTGESRIFWPDGNEEVFDRRYL
jgi:hypothetical protein